MEASDAPFSATAPLDAGASAPGFVPRLVRTSALVANADVVPIAVPETPASARAGGPAEVVRRVRQPCFI
jgi:hypothetical protein